MELHQRPTVRYAVADHRADDAHVVNVPRQFREQFAERNAALAVSFELKRRFQQPAHLFFGKREGALERQRLAVIAFEPGLGVIDIEVRRAAVHENEDRPLGPRLKMRLLRGKRVARFFSSQQPAQAEQPESAGGPAQERPAR